MIFIIYEIQSVKLTIQQKLAIKIQIWWIKVTNNMWSASYREVVRDKNDERQFNVYVTQQLLQVSKI